MQTFKDFSARVSEDDCLDEIMRVQSRGAPCPACDATAGFAPVGKHRAVACRACGYKVFPCVGTPFARPQPPMTHWFYAVAASEPSGRLLRRELGLEKASADKLSADVSALKAASASGIDWTDVVKSFVATRAPEPTIVGATAPDPVSSDAPETLWRTLAAPFASLTLDRRPLLGIGLIGVLVAAGLGVAWIMSPGEQEEDTELAQATAILSLGEKKPVILVSKEVADQLYDVSDVDPTPDSPLQTSIRLAPQNEDPNSPQAAEDAKPISSPSIKLSGGVGQSLLDGDLSAAKRTTANRPELAAYSSLAQALETGPGKNPDELLNFGPIKIRRHLVDKIYRAAKITSVDPVLLMAIADKESSFVTEAQASTSSASGLYQFIEKTWFGVVREFGPRYGLDREARMIDASGMGVADRVRILDMRRDAYLSAVLAAEMLKRDSLRIQRRIGRPLTGGEVYLVHFLGPDGAERLIEKATAAPNAVAAELLPKPAEANKSIFYASAAGGTKAVSVTELRAKFDTMISVRLDRYKTVGGAAHPPSTPPKK